MSPPPPPAPKRETKSPLPPKPTGGSPLPEIQKKEKPPTSPQTGGGTPPSGAKNEENSFKKKSKKKEKKENLVNITLAVKTDSSKTRWGHLPSREKMRSRKLPYELSWLALSLQFVALWCPCTDSRAAAKKVGHCNLFEVINRRRKSEIIE